MQPVRGKELSKKCTPESFSGRERLRIGKEKDQEKNPDYRQAEKMVAFVWFMSNGQAARCTPDSFSGKERL